MEGWPAEFQQRHRARHVDSCLIADPERNEAEGNAAEAKEMQPHRSGARDGKNFRNRILRKRARGAARSRKAEARPGRRRLRLRKSKRTVWRHLSRALI